MAGRLGSSVVLKKNSSSGCLIIRRRSENKDAVVALEGLKRHRSIASVGGSSTEDESLEYVRRNVSDNALHNGSMVCKIETEGSLHGGNYAQLKINGERKRRSRFEEFESDELDTVGLENTSKLVKHSGFGKLNEFRLGSLCGSLAVEKRNQDSYFGSSSVRSKGVEYGGGKVKGFELEDEASKPISLLRLKYQERADQPIRFQGKNGVLKVLVSKNKKMDLPSQYKNNNPKESEERKGLKSEDVAKKDILAQLPLFSASKPPESPGLFIEGNKMVKKKRRERKLVNVKPVLNKYSKARDSEINGTDMILKLAPPGLEACISKDGVKKEDKRSPIENVIPVKMKEGKGKRGGNTEKQMLREKIRKMLVDSGWTIDRRRRRNRDYLDAVYINPRGITYWSIVKAYDAFKKQLVAANGKSKSDPSFSSLSEDLINKLTRQTKNKIELERKRKRKEDDMIKCANKSAVRDSAKCSDHVEDKGKDMPQKGELCEVDKQSEHYLNCCSPKKKPTKDTVKKPSIALNSNLVQERTREIIRRGTFKVRSFNTMENTESKEYVPYTGKRTVLAWLIDSGIARLGEKLLCLNRNRTRVILEGWITRDGIHCGCCSQILTVSKFELHAGTKLRQPFENILLESGDSLLQCQIDAWNRQASSLHLDFHAAHVDDYDPRDDKCSICGHGGNLIGCDRCPSTVHENCLEKILYSVDWRCSSCTCKFCGNVSGNAAEENDNYVGELVRCSFCEQNYHLSCSERSYSLPWTSDGTAICGLKCQELYEYMQKILGVKQELEAGYSWSLIQRTDISDASCSGFSQRVECNSKLAVALSIMDECFLPIFDRSGINTMHNVVYNYGSNFSRLNYDRFYTAILERGEEIISAASIRIHGTLLAEMPFIGTCAIYRRKGMCQLLLSAIETELCSLGVAKLVVPALSEQMDMWTTVFGFNQLKEVQKRELKSLNILVFPGTDMLQKQLLKEDFSGADPTSASY